MTHGDFAAPQVRKLRLGVMGEFSAGKSTLCNLLLGARPLTERVTATRLSPVWITKGAPALEREFLDGAREPVAFADLKSVPIKDTRSIRLYDEAEVLDMFDLIDFPGISDPNMPTEVWERLVPEIDAVLWCTHANQAWRQSEAEVWRAIPDDVKARSLLLVTRYDTIPSERDKARMLARVRHETDGLFAGLFPIALTQALEAEDDPEAWAASGAEPFIAHLVDVIAAMQMQLEQGQIEDRTPYVERTMPEGPVHVGPVSVGTMSEAAEGDTQSASTPPAEHLSPTGAMADPETDDWFVKSAETMTDPVEAAAPAETGAPDIADIDDMWDTAETGYAQAAPETDPAAEIADLSEPEPAAPNVKSPISLMPRRTAAPADATAAPAILPRRVRAEGMRRTERPRGDAAVRALRIDDLPQPEDQTSPEDLRSAFSPR